MLAIRLCLTIVALASKSCVATSPYKILVLNPFPGRSHSMSVLRITEGLIQKGHQVTSVGYFPVETSVPNYVHKNLTKAENVYVSFFNLSSFTGSRVQRWNVMKIVHQYSSTICGTDFASDSVRKLANEISNFDVIIIPMFCTDCFLSFMYKLKAPVVGIVSLGIMEWLIENSGSTNHPAYIPNNLMDYANPMSFWVRTENLLVGWFQSFYYKQFIESIGEEVAREYFGEELPSLRSLARQVNPLLSNSHFTYFFSRPLVPSVMEIGGIHLGKRHKLPNVC